MRFILSLLLTLGLQAVSTEVNPLGKKWESNKNCEACHQYFSKKWETSRHSHAHYNKNDLFKKSLDYIVRKNPTLVLDEVKVECAQCHNPRLAKRDVSNEEKVALLFGDKETKTHFRNLLDNKTMENGINCMVCHNIDKIHMDKIKADKGGMYGVTFGPLGTMYGPFADSHSPYHKSERRDHFATNEPTLCFVCHYGKKNKYGLWVYETGKEYERYAERPDEGCKECHMSKKRKGYASNYAPPGDTPKERMIRQHRFASVDNSNILLDYVDIKGKTEDSGAFSISLTNRAPHKVPTGYGLRQVILKVTFMDRNDKPIKSIRYVLGAEWLDAQGNVTIPHLATKIGKDTRLEGKTTKVYKFKVPQNATYVKYGFSYRLIDEKLAKEMGVSDPFFLREYTFFEQRLHL